MSTSHPTTPQYADRIWPGYTGSDDDTVPLHRLFASAHRTAEGIPAGGWSQAIGALLTWQEGPLGPDRPPNGVDPRTLIGMVIDRLLHENSGAPSEWRTHTIEALQGCLYMLHEHEAVR